MATAAIVLFCALGVLPSAPASAQVLAAQNGLRQFPPAALRGKLAVTAPPEISLDSKADRLSPGSRIYNAQNQLVMSASLVGHEVLVNYVRDNAGLVHQVWILNEAEAKEKRPGASSGRNFLFSSDPPKIDPNTPFDKLPKYKP